MPDSYGWQARIMDEWQSGQKRLIVFRCIGDQVEFITADGQFVSQNALHNAPADAGVIKYSIERCAAMAEMVRVFMTTTPAPLSEAIFAVPANVICEGDEVRVAATPRGSELSVWRKRKPNLDYGSYSRVEDD